MEIDLQKRIDGIVARVGKLTGEINRERRGRVEAEDRVRELEGEVARLSKEIEARDREIEYLKVARLAGSKEETERTRAVISGLVREIDKCIADLSE